MVYMNQLLYMDDLKLYARSEKGLESLVHIVRIFSSDIWMDFGVTKGAKLAIRKGKVIATERIKLPDDREIKNLEKGDSYKYLGVLELDEVQCKINQRILAARKEIAVVQD